MKLGQVTLSALIASTLIAAPVAANAAPLPVARTSTSVEGEQLRGAGFGLVIAAIIAALVVLIAVSDEDEDLPRSP